MKNPKSPLRTSSTMPTITDNDEEDESESESEQISLLTSNQHQHQHQHEHLSPHAQEARSRATLLAFSLFLNLGIFWLLDSLKDHVFAILVGDHDDSNENFESNQPLAKMVSVLSTFVLVFVLEKFMKQSNEISEGNETEIEIKTNPHKNQEEQVEDQEWQSMDLKSSHDVSNNSNSNSNSNGDLPAMSMISHVHIPYSLLFLFVAVLLQRYPAFGNNLASPFFASKSSTASSDTSQEQKIVGYILYVAIESFGSLSVAAFWSYTNSNLDLESAKQHYGVIIAAAQIGAIMGSTVASFEFLSIPNMFLLSSALMICNMLFMVKYHVWFPTPLQSLKQEDTENHPIENRKRYKGYKSNQKIKQKPFSHSSKPKTKSISKSKSGLFLILQHKYLLSILAVSCLYEVSLTCLDYEMKLVGLSRFNLSQENSTFNFKTFMSRYGQLTNGLSLLFSFFGFPYWMKHHGVKYTLRLFPGFLVGLTILTFTILPSNLWLLFYSMAVLKAMTYSINDPAKEILYMPTSNIIKVKAKFWIDVVGARFAKALGSSITNYAGSADRLVKVGGVPSVLASLIFLYFCIQVGEEFEWLVKHGIVVGEEDNDDDGHDDDLKYDINMGDYYEQDDDDDDDNEEDYLVSMDPFTYKSKGVYENDPETNIELRTQTKEEQ